MVGRITELPERVRNQIAAGEVVERPASIVKELVENALDAGARDVRVDLEEGGCSLVRVTDDGSGMGLEDLALAFRPHATSKLRDVGDLEHIASLGFRGEALASIGSVARCRIFSREPGAAHGHAVLDEGGRVAEAREAGGAEGTVVEVRDLFYNTPARRRFLKRPATELSHCLAWIQRMALAHPGVGFVATHGGKRVLDVEARMELRDRVRRLFGGELADALVDVHADDGTTRLDGLLAPPRFSRTDRGRQMWFLNGRFLRDKVLVRCLKDAYRGFLVEGRQPVAFLALAMDPALVDVNVHPTKSEVRFREERRMYGFLHRALKEGVLRTDVATPGESLLARAESRGAWRPPDRDPAQPNLPHPGPLEPREPRARDELEVYELRPEAPARVGEAASPASAGASGPRSDAPGGGADPSDGWSAPGAIRGPFLQIDRTYIVRGLVDGFEIIDQHALHERLTFEGLKADVRRGAVEVQRFLVPELVELSRAEVGLVEEHREALARLGIELSAFGPTTVAVGGLPARLRHPDAEGLVRDVLAVLEERGRPPSVEDVLEEVLHRAACRSSVMAGDELGESAIRSLLERAAALESDQTCPHARPTRVRFTLADLEKAFHRR